MKIYTKRGGRGDGEHMMTYASKVKNGTTTEEVLVNTVINFLAVDEKQEKFLLGIGEAEKMELKIFTLKDLGNKGDFSKLIRPWSFFGTAADYEYLLNFWRVQNIKKKLIYLNDFVGRHKDELVDFWVLDKEVVIIDAKEPIESFSEVTEVINLKKINYEGTTNFVVGGNWYWVESAGVVKELRPMVIKNVEIGKENVLNVKEYLNLWGRQYKNTTLNYCILGWFIGLMYMDEVTEMRGDSFYPLFALNGLTQTGKTSLIANYLKFWGLEAKPTDYTQVSNFVEIKQLGNVHSMPVWRDEYREGVGNTKAKETIIRSLYNRASLSKGTANQQMINYSVKSSLLLSGEDGIQDPATRRRVVFFSLMEEHKVDVKEWEIVMIESDRYFWHIFFVVLKAGFNKGWFTEVYEYAMDKLQTVNDKKEEGLCYASLGAVFGTAFGKAVVDDAVKYWQMMSKFDGGIQRADILEQFWEIADTYFDRNGFYDSREMLGVYQKAKILDIFWYNKNGKVFVKPNMLINYVWKDAGFGTKSTLSPKSIENVLIVKYKGESTRRSMGGKQQRGVVFDPQIVPKFSILWDILVNVKNAQWQYEKDMMLRNEEILEKQYLDGELTDDEKKILEDKSFNLLPSGDATNNS